MQQDVLSEEVYTQTKCLSITEELDSWICPEWNKNGYKNSLNFYVSYPLKY